MTSDLKDFSEAESNPSFELDPRWQLVQRIISSRHFAKSVRLQEFLIYVCRCELTEKQSEINEQLIGERVFRRSAHYNPNEDNIVRSQARLVRQKLDAYFSAEGESEPLRLVIPKGGYRPEFIEHSDQVPTVPVASDVTVRTGLRSPLTRWLVAVMVLLVIVVILQGWSLLRSNDASRNPKTPAPNPSIQALWSQLFNDKMVTTVIVPDSTIGMLQEASKQPVDLATYLRRPPTPDTESVKDIEAALRGFSIRRYTTFDSVGTAVKVSQLAEQFRARSIVRYARDMTLRDFSPGNVVLIGRHTVNPWIEMFEPGLNFTFFSDLRTETAICRNRSPQAGEQAEYPPINEGAKRTVYAAVALVPNLNDAGNVLIIAGTSSGAQEVAAEFLTNENLLNSFAETLPRNNDRLPYFEILIRTVTLAGVAQEPEVIAYRVLQR